MNAHPMAAALADSSKPLTRQASPEPNFATRLVQAAQRLFPHFEIGMTRRFAQQWKELLVPTTQAVRRFGGTPTTLSRSPKSWWSFSAARWCRNSIHRQFNFWVWSNASARSRWSVARTASFTGFPLMFSSHKHGVENHTWH